MLGIEQSRAARQRIDDDSASPVALPNFWTMTRVYAGGQSKLHGRVLCLLLG